MIDATEKELNSAQWRVAAKEAFAGDMVNYDLLATELGVTRTEAMLLNALSLMLSTRETLIHACDLIHDYHHRDFPEKWHPCDEHGKDKPDA